MTVRTQYTYTARRSILCLFACDKCGEINLCEVSVSGSGTYNDACAFRRSKLEDRKERAEMYAGSEMESNIYDLCQGMDINTLRKRNFHCKCKKCGKSPYWTFSALPILKAISMISLVLLIVALLSEHLNGVFRYACIAAAVLAWAGRFIYLYVNNAKSKSCAYPLFGENIEELREKAARSVAYRNYSFKDVPGGK